MRKTILFAAATLAVAVPAFAQDAAPAAPSASEQADIDRGGIIFGSFSQAVRSDQITEQEKNALFGCMYDNSIKAIAEQTGKVLAANPQIDATKPENVFNVAAVVCGARKAKTADDSAAAPATPAPQSR
ncbi:hypothetical protein [Novosphingopyxis sp. YJ-S2-01]|uniref:hypothetical protein n=1 Tax=Novosphingopyxis sp. YJ-S2-01 TaxID=2794021 RepID=UPI0018DE0F79|nr:hypothetical protein [Novosphingopyxis sp. YJ-S2-01]MBH9538127.1 hypothetical protein [Novosphingopyxis sp. YJ-S2-01]